MNGEVNDSSGLTGTTKFLLGLVGIFAVVGLILFLSLKASPASRPAPAAGNANAPMAAAPTATLAPGGPVKIQIVTTDTKAEWLGAVTKEFNDARRVTAAGHLIQVEMVQVGGPEEMKEKVLAGLAGGTSVPALLSPGDISWIEAINQLLEDKGQPRIVTEECPPIVKVPTGFTMWRPMAEALGWPDKPISWQQIVELAGDPQGWAKYGHREWGQLTFGHPHPDGSTTGFNFLASLAYAAVAKTEGLTPQDVRSDKVKDYFRRVETNTYRYGLSTRGLLTPMARGGPGYLHAAAASETSFIATMKNDKAFMMFPLAFVFPAEGVFWSDNPTCILRAKGVTEEQREAAGLYRTYLLAPPAQEKAVEIGLRPVAPGIALKFPISLDNGTDPGAPEKVPALANVSGETRDAIIDIFKQTKKKATVAVLLDTSLSMNGVAIKNATAGAAEFLGRLHPDDEVVFYRFADDVAQLAPSGRAGDVVEKLRVTVSNLYPDGNTALYDAVCTGVQTIDARRTEDRAAGEKRLYAVVLLSDGKDSGSSKKWQSESAMFSCLPSGEDVNEVKVYTIAYGNDADKDLLLRIANRTKGKAFEATPENIKTVYENISAEQ